jgi:hypothetical protein
MQEKTCTKCRASKPFDAFSPSSQTADGRWGWCKACKTLLERARPPEYKCWKNMNARCKNPKAKSYEHYGARGIRVHPEWRGEGGYEKFIAYVGPKPSPEHQLDRIDNNGHYEPGNVRWTPRTVNIRNRSNTRHLTLNGETRPVAEWAEQFGVGYSTINRRVKQGWTAEEALFGRKPA